MERKLRDKLPEGAFTNVHPQHSRIMKNVRGKGNRTTEARFRAALAASGISGWKVNIRQLKGSPDFYFPAERLAIFVDGCFWHGCASCGHIPNTNKPFWETKIDSNRKRDMRNTAILRKQGVSVIRFWEHEIRFSLKACIDDTMKRLERRRYQMTTMMREQSE